MRLLAIIAALLLPAAARAQDVPALEIPVPGLEFTPIIREADITIPWLAQYIGGIYTFLISIVGVLAACMMIYGGFQYATSAGDKSRIGAAKKRITDALVGLLLALGSYTVLFAINPDLVSFEGLKIAGVRTELYEQGIDDRSSADLQDDEIPSESTPTEPTVMRAGYPKLCDSAASCLPHCVRAGCTKIFCTKKEMAGGYAANCINETRRNDCDWDRFPRLDAPGILESGSPDLVDEDDWPKMANVRAREGTKASKLVIAGLQRADRYIDQNHAGKGLSIQINNCWRDWRDDANAQCSIIARPTLNDPTAWFSSWPGAGPHNSGYACDLVLMKDGKPISGVKSDQTCTSKAAGNRLLIEILTNPTVGAKRLKYESWHFNWAGWNSCFCAMEGCEPHIYPVGSGPKKCTHGAQPKAC